MICFITLPGLMAGAFPWDMHLLPSTAKFGLQHKSLPRSCHSEAVDEDIECLQRFFSS